MLIDYTDMDARARTVDAHRAHLAQGRASGVVADSGPFVDGKGGMYVLDVRDEAEARAFVDADPYRKDGGLVLTLREYKSALDAKG